MFDVMILSPRAGGVGLTLTAASHVIHLAMVASYAAASFYRQQVPAQLSLTAVARLD
jgi:hypothetical protein